ncbi:MAG: trypsin-like peptidase domain-containing protein, partial [Chloroflexi bacterium]|nr:trypsin-like peptidase domain-containing protein [Chloroflexota bacterium]
SIQTFFGAQQQTGSGSGVIFREDGYILTNNHVVDGASDITVTLFDNRQFDGTVVGTFPDNDLAVIKIEEKGLPTLPFRTTSSLRVGDWVVAIGNAAGLPGKPTVTLGIVSAVDRSLQTGGAQLNDLIQTDAVINPGNSGGPLVNLQGEVVGINSAILRGSQIDGIGFAISADTARLVADQLVRNGRVIWPFMGVGLDDIDIPTAAERNLSVREGALIKEVEPGSPAAQAGLRLNDVIVAVDGKTVPSVKALLQLLRGEYKVGQRATVAVIRGNDRKEFTVTLGERP